MNKVINHLKNKWGIKSTWSFIAINLTFAGAGMSVLFVKKYLFLLMGIPDDLSFWIKLILFLILVFPLYQLLLLAWGFVFGHARFFWDYEKKIIRHLISLKRYFRFIKSH